MKVTPEQINNLKPNEIFVFGSNLDGFHAGGAAYFAVKNFGAKMGQAEGLQGQSYALPTLSHAGGVKEHMLPLNVIQGYVNDLLATAEANPEKIFYVTPVGCGIAGFTPEQIAPMFKPAINMNNVALPQSFIDVLGNKKELDKDNNKNWLSGIVNKVKNKLPLTESEFQEVIKETVKMCLTENISSDEAIDRLLK